MEERRTAFMYSTVEEGMKTAPAEVTAKKYLLWMRDEFIRDTPFTYADIRLIHDMIKGEREDFGYQWETLRRIIKAWVQQELIIVLDEGGGQGASDQTYLWSKYVRDKRPVEGIQAVYTTLEIILEFLKRLNAPESL